MNSLNRSRSTNTRPLPPVHFWWLMAAWAVALLSIRQVFLASAPAGSGEGLIDSGLTILFVIGVGLCYLAMDAGHRRQAQLVEDAAGQGDLGAGAPFLPNATNALVIEGLRRALSGDRGLSLHYQPIVRLDTGEVVRYEALVRWRSSDFGDVPPDIFVPLAESAGLIHQLTSWVAQRAIAQLARWREEGRDVSVSINLSAKDLAVPDLASRLASLAAHHGVPTSAIELELTECLALHDLDEALGVLDSLARQGFRVALDDFGVGHTAVARLIELNLHVHTIKLDRLFASNLSTHPSAKHVAAACVSICNALGKECVVEGIETADEADFFAALGCAYGQGYLFGRPAPATFGHEPAPAPVSLASSIPV